MDHEHDHRETSHRDHAVADFSRHHMEMQRFPTVDDLREMDERWGIERGLDPTAMAARLDRHVTQVTTDVLRGRDLLFPASEIKLLLEPWIWKLLRALLRTRVNHRALDGAARERFNLALEAAHADGSYQALSVVHSQNHMMHSMMGPLGTQRFLPWHRLYLFRLENVLRQKQPSVLVPYWDYANDHERPDWVWQPQAVVRNAPGPDGLLPTQATIDSMLTSAFYTELTSNLESRAHNQVHNWCNGTITSPATAAQDPIFWLLHANVDRIWDKWQLNHTGVPALSGMDAVLEPWEPSTAADVNDVLNVGYSYG
ncbi:MAG: tyrosinase family protein [Frankiaceae bacterium]